MCHKEVPVCVKRAVDACGGMLSAGSRARGSERDYSVCEGAA